MAIANELGTGRINRALQKMLSMKGLANVRQLAGEVLPVLPFFFGVENRYLESWEKFGIGISTAAQGAGNAGGVRVRNPANSGVIIVIEKASYGSASATDEAILESGANSTDLVNIASSTIAFDPRGRTASIAIVSFTAAQNAPAVGITRDLKTLAANTSVDFIVDENQEITLLPGQAIQLRQSTANAIANMSFWWRERLLEESERF